MDAVRRLRDDLEARIESLEAELRLLRRRRDAALTLLGELHASATPDTVTDMLPETAAAVSLHAAKNDKVRELARAGWTLRRLERALKAYGRAASKRSAEAVGAAVEAGVPLDVAEAAAAVGDQATASVGVSFVQLSRLLGGQYRWRQELREAIHRITGVRV